MPLLFSCALVAVLGLIAGCGDNAGRQALEPAAAAPVPMVVRLLTRATFDESGAQAVLRPAYTGDGLGGRALA